MATTQVNGINGVNGVSPHSAFLDHLLQYPVVSDSVSTVKQNKYGQQTIALSSSALDTLTKSLLPYLSKPFGLVSPYVQKVDSLGDRTLDTIDSRFPVVKKPTAEVFQDTKELVLYPVRQGLAGRDHFFAVYTGERKQIGGDGILPRSKALATTVVVVTNETLSWLRHFVSSSKQTVQEKTNNMRS